MNKKSRDHLMVFGALLTFGLSARSATIYLSTADASMIVKTYLMVALMYMASMFVVTPNYMRYFMEKHDAWNIPTRKWFWLFLGILGFFLVPILVVTDWFLEMFKMV